MEETKERKYISTREVYLWMKAYQKGERKKDEELVSARAHNIIYGMVKGKSYKQIENKVKEGNKPKNYPLEKVIKKYGLDENDFFNIISPTQKELK